MPWDLFGAGRDPVRGSSWLNWGDSVSPPCLCMVPPADHQEGLVPALGRIVRQGKAGGFSRGSCEDLAGGGRKDLSLHCGSSGGVVRRTSLMCRNAACQNHYSANLLKNNFLCATMKFI